MTSGGRIAAGGLLALAFVLGWWIAAPARGYLAAQYDVHRGHYVTLGYGLRVSWHPEFVRLLRERYGVEYYPAAGCMVSPSLRAYVDAYDSVSHAAANRKFGHDIFAEVAKNAREAYEQAHPVAAR